MGVICVFALTLVDALPERLDLPLHARAHPRLEHGLQVRLDVAGEYGWGVSSRGGSRWKSVGVMEELNNNSVCLWS